MKTSRRSNLRHLAGKLAIGLVLALMIGGINVAPAFSRDHDQYMDNRDNRRYEHRGRGYDRSVRYEHDRRYDRRYDRRGYRHYGHRERGYYYDSPGIFIAPPPPPGIGIFFPPIIIQP